MIIQKIKGLDVEVKKYKPEYNFVTKKLTNSNSFLLSYILGIRSAGKSTLMSNILSIDENIYFAPGNKVILISPTLNMDFKVWMQKYPDKFQYIDELDINIWRNVVTDIYLKIDKWKREHTLMLLLNKYYKGEKLNDREKILLESNEYFIDYEFTEVSATPPQTTIIIDDFATNKLLQSGSKESKEFFSWILKHRHAYTNVFVLTQTPKFHKNYRSNANLICIFPMRNRTVMEEIFKEYSGLFGGEINNYWNVIDEIEKRANRSFIYMYYDEFQELRINLNEKVTF